MDNLEKERIRQLIRNMNLDEKKIVASMIPSSILAKEISYRIESFELKFKVIRSMLESEDMNIEKKELSIMNFMKKERE